MSLGERIRHYRQMSGLSQETLASLLDISRQAVAKWERNRTMPSTANLLRLAEIFSVSVDELLGLQSQNTVKQSGHTVNGKRRVCRFAVLITLYLLLYLTGRLICGDLQNSSFLGWLTGTDSKYYLFGWLIHRKLFWYAMTVSSFPVLFGQFLFGVSSFVGCTIGLLLGEWLGVYPPGIPYDHDHYGWAIWIGVYLLSCMIGIVLCVRLNHKTASSR